VREPGGLHPVSLTQERIELIFASMGFDVADGPEVESDWHSFTSLNNPPNHPARSMQDTFYVDIDGDDGIPYNLRPHTSPMQVRYAHQHIKRYAEAVKRGEPMPEIRVIAPGRTYRVDSDATHSPMFHQCEGLWLGENVSFKDLKVVFTDFCRTFFESDDLALRFRPSFFPFTEPSAEMDVECQLCHGSGCPSCKGTGWMEILGSGMVHPSVINASGLDADRYSGWAFGMGPARIAMLRYDIPDIRILYDSDVRFLYQIAR
jgi:phenylalanyl-tRNA synthetase alpha chain